VTVEDLPACQRGRLPVAPDGPGESRLGAVIDVSDAVLRHERVVVPLVIGHASGERRDMPVQVGIALLAAKAKAEVRG
jgi:hypothetical protein